MEVGLPFFESWLASILYIFWLIFSFVYPIFDLFIVFRNMLLSKWPNKKFLYQL
jgi:hypothetical protein